MSTKYVLLGIIGLGILAVGAFFLAFQEESSPVNGDNVQAEFETYTAETLASFEGKPVIANSWAVWCPFCVKELDDFVTVQKELGEDIVILAINRRESPSRMQGFLEDLGLQDDLIFLQDPTDSFYREKLNGFSMPETIFITKEGEIHFHKRGPMNAQEIRERAQEIL